MPAQTLAYSTKQFGKNIATLPQQPCIIIDSQPQITREDLLDILAETKTILQQALAALS